ncbi:hypothetical protein DID88_009408 [Monilinia fructigena]|uniref:TauD/TfdA-like domain-containing protein n=1 Tax=Monilinia fructigena TaxID=38457 RepID=A0A395IT12_9HELO|nr:hypothetical protein DID88_009408 [Monilinia fructigena]
MHRLFRGSHTARAVAASHFPQTAPIRDCRISSLIPWIEVAKPSLASHASHLRAVHETLVKKGVLQLQLGFVDDESLAERGWFWDVRPSPSSFQSNAHQARSETMLFFDWHTDCSYETDPPRFFALQVLQPDRYDGGTLSVLNLDRILTLLSPFARKWLSQREYKITVPPEFVKKGGERHIVGNLLAASGEEMHVGSLRFREDITVPLTQNASKALAELKDILKNDRIQAETIHLKPETLPRGSIIMMDNRRWLHSRNEVKDPERHLRRVRWDATQFGA